MKDQQNKTPSLYSNKAPSEHPGKTEAIAWLTYLYCGATTQEKRDEFILWINKSHTNKNAFIQSHKVWQTIGMTDTSVEWLQQYAQETPVPLTAKKPKHRFAKSAVWLSGIAASILFIVFNDAFKASFPLKTPTSDTVFTSPIGENRHITLSDGTEVTLAGNSSILVSMNEHERRISLYKGGAYFDVTHDSKRIFLVSAQNTEVRVRGTAFEVEHSTDSELKVSVQRGLVDVADLPEYGSKDEKVVQLHPNEQLRTDMDGTFINGITLFNPDIEFAWLNARLIYDNVPLNHVIMDINRYVKKPVIILDERINDFPITASFTFEQIDSVLAGLVAAYPITLTEEETRTVLIKNDS